MYQKRRLVAEGRFQRDRLETAEQEDEVGMLEVVEPEPDVWRLMRC